MSLALLSLPPVTGDHSKQDLRYTQKPIHLPIFTNNIWSYLLLWSTQQYVLAMRGREFSFSHRMDIWSVSERNIVTMNVTITAPAIS